jgi:hypothetical protein
MTWILDGSDYGDGRAGDPPLAVCRDVAGAFADRPPPRARERFTLLGCVPEGPLRAAVAGAWLGNVVVDPGVQELTDVTVIEIRPGAPGRFDIELEGLIRHEPEMAIHAVEVKPDATEFLLDAGALGRCADVAGVYREMPETWETTLTLLGCRPGPHLTPGTELLGELCSIAYDGRPVPTLMRAFRGSVAGVRPSAHGDGLVDVEFDSGFIDPSPAAAKGIWEMWQRAAPARRNLWARYDPELRLQWAGAAMRHSRPAGGPAGHTYELDGRHVTDLPGFYCAVGEAVNGPGGYFGWNWHALRDCLSGGFGAATPFTLVWHDSDVARRHLDGGYDRDRHLFTDTFDDVVGLLAEKGVDVVLR